MRKKKNNYRAKLIFCIVFLLFAILVQMRNSIAVPTIINTTIRYDVAIADAFVVNQSAEVLVGIYLKDESGLMKDNERNSWFTNRINEVFLNLTEEDFRMLRRSSDGFNGYVTKQGFNKLINDSRIEVIHINIVGSIALDDSIPLIEANVVWNLGYNGTGKKVCVIDSGVNASHPDLSEKIKGEYCYCSSPDSKQGTSYCCPDGTVEDNDAEDNHGHGTHVAGIVVSQDSTYKGVAPGVDIYVVKVANSSGHFLFIPDLRDAIDKCKSWNVSVISMSLGDNESHPGTSACPTTVDSNINTAYKANISLFAASGNDYFTTGINYPACSPNVTSVGATDKDDNLASFTNRKSGLLDLLAPGKNIWSLRWNPNGNSPGCLGSGGFMLCSGTSQATPHVAGAAALLLGKKSDATPDEIKEALVNTGINIAGYPRINVSGAIDYICDKDRDNYDSNVAGCGGNDCNDNNGGVNPSIVEICFDGIDNDCDNLIDEGCISDCNETGYYQCTDYTFGNCRAKIAANWYENVNNISWGVVNDSYDPFVISQYKIGWKGIIAKQMYYNCNGSIDCSFGGCSCGGLVIEGTKITTTSPGTAHTDTVLGYNDTISNWCSVQFNSFNPNYGSSNPVFVLNCFNDSHCSGSQFCNKTGIWNNWACITRQVNGSSCTSNNQCLSGYCDNDGVGLSDDNWCFTPHNNYFDGQEISYCEISTDIGANSCDERQAGDDLNKCVGTSYYEEECSNTCEETDVTNIFECTETGCSCPESLCDGLTTGSNITTCSANETYLADKCTATASGENRGDNICRSSAFASGCSASSQCNGIVAGTGNCTASCSYNQYPTNPTSLLCDGALCVNNVTFINNIAINCSGSTDAEGNSITYFIDAYYNSSSEQLNWWNTSWAYKQKFNISENNKTQQLNYTIPFVLNVTSLYNDGKMRADCKDIRFVNSTETEELNYYIEYCNYTGKNSFFWIKVPNIPANKNVTIYMYYGNPNISYSTSNSNKTFLMFNDFSGTGTVPNGWNCDDLNYRISCSFANGYFNYTNSDNWAGPKYILANYSNASIEARINLYGNSPLIGLKLRDQSPNATSIKNFYIAYTQDNGPEELGKWLSGTGNLLNDPASEEFVQPSSNSFYIYRFAIIDNLHNFTVFADNSTYNNTILGELSGSDNNTFTSGYAGFSANTPFDGFRIDWARVRQFVLPEPTINIIGDEEIFGIGWRNIGNHNETSVLNWNIVNILQQSGVGLRCKAIDLNGRNAYSSYYNPSINITISTIPNDTNKFFVKNTSGSNIAWFGNKGNIVLKGKCYVQTNCASDGNSFVIANSTDNAVAVINSTGSLCIEKGDCSDSSPSCNPPRDAFIIQNLSGGNVSYIDFSGDLCLTGKLNENVAVIQ